MDHAQPRHHPAPEPVVNPRRPEARPERGSDRPSECQWAVCFWLELNAIRPFVPAAVAMRWGRALARTAGDVAPERAAVAFASGLLGLRLH